MSKPDSEKIIEQLVSNTRALLQDHWKKAEAVFAATNIKINMQHLIDFEPADVTAKTTIAFGARVKDSVEMTIPDGDSMLPMGEIPQRPKRGRPPKTQTFSSNVPPEQAR
jgi:hypothetical protein